MPYVLHKRSDMSSVITRDNVKVGYAQEPIDYVLL